MIDNQSVKTTESGAVRGYDPCNKIKHRKRHIITVTNGFLVRYIAQTADIQDYNGALMMFKGIRYSLPWRRHDFEDSGYVGNELRRARKYRRLDDSGHQALRLR